MELCLLPRLKESGSTPRPTKLSTRQCSIRELMTLLRQGSENWSRAVLCVQEEILVIILDCVI